MTNLSRFADELPAAEKRAGAPILMGRRSRNALAKPIFRRRKKAPAEVRPCPVFGKCGPYSFLCPIIRSGTARRPRGGLLVSSKAARSGTFEPNRARKSGTIQKKRGSPHSGRKETVSVPDKAVLFPPCLSQRTLNEQTEDVPALRTEAPSSA